MAKRRISSVRRSRYSTHSSRGSGFLDPDTGILGDEQSFWWKNLEDNTIVRHSVGSELGNQTSQYLNASSHIDLSNAEDGWWKPLENADMSISTKIVTENTRNTKPVRSYVKSTSESEEEDRIEKRKLPLRAAARRSRNSNAFLKALDSSSGSTLTGPVQTRRERSLNNSRLNLAAAQHPGTHLITPQDSSDNQSHTTDVILKPKPKILVKKNLITGNNNLDGAVKEGVSSSPSNRRAHRISKAELSRMLIENKDSPIGHQHRTKGFVLDFENNESLHWPPPTAQSTIIEQSSMLRANKSINDSDSDPETYRLKRMASNRNRRSTMRNAFDNILEDESSAAEEQSRTLEKDGVAVNVDRQVLINQNLMVQLEDIRKLSKSGSNNKTNVILENKQSTKGSIMSPANKNTSVSSSSRKHENRSIIQKNLLVEEDNSESASDLSAEYKVVLKSKSKFLRSAREETEKNNTFLNVLQESEHNTSKAKLLQSRTSAVAVQGTGRLTANISGVEALENVMSGTSSTSKTQALRHSSKNKTHRELSRSEQISGNNNDDISFSTSESTQSQKNSRVINDSTLRMSKHMNNIENDIDYTSDSETRSRSNIIPETSPISRSQTSRQSSKSKTHKESSRSEKISASLHNSRVINDSKLNKTSKHQHNIEDDIEYTSDSNTSSKSDITDDDTESHVSPSKKSRQDFVAESQHVSHKEIECEEDLEGYAKSSKHQLLDALGDDLNNEARASPILGRLSNDRKSHPSKLISKTRRTENNKEIANENQLSLDVSRASINSRKSQPSNRTDQRKIVGDNQYFNKTGNEEIIPNSQVVQNEGQAGKENRSIARKHSGNLGQSQRQLIVSDSEHDDNSKEDSDDLSTRKNKTINKSRNQSTARTSFTSRKAIEDSSIRASNKLKKLQQSVGILSSDDDDDDSDKNYHSKSRNKILDKSQSRPVTQASSISHRDVSNTPSSRSSRRIKSSSRSQNLVPIHSSDNNGALDEDVEHPTGRDRETLNMDDVNSKRSRSMTRSQDVMTVPNSRDNDDSFEERQDPLRRETRSLTTSQNRRSKRISSTVRLNENEKQHNISGASRSSSQSRKRVISHVSDDNQASTEEFEDEPTGKSKSNTLSKPRNQSVTRVTDISHTEVQDSSTKRTRSSSRLQGSSAANYKKPDDSAKEADDLNSQTKTKALSKSRNEDRDGTKKYRKTLRRSHKQLTPPSSDDKDDSNEETQQLSERRKISNRLQKRSLASVMENSDEREDQNILEGKARDLNRSQKSLNASTANNPDEGNLNLSKAESTSRKSRKQSGAKVSGPKISQEKVGSSETNKKNSIAAPQELIDVLTHDDVQSGNEDVLEDLAKNIKKSNTGQPQKEKDRHTAEKRKSSVARRRTITQASDHSEEDENDSAKVSNNNLNRVETRLSTLFSSLPDNENKSARDEGPVSRALNYSRNEEQQAVSKTQAVHSNTPRISSAANEEMIPQERKDASNQLEKGKKSLKKNLSKTGSNTNTSKIQKNLDNFFKVTTPRSTTTQLSTTNLIPGTSASQSFADNSKMQEIKKELQKVKEQEMAAMKAKSVVHKVKLPVIGNHKKLPRKPNQQSQTKHQVDKAYLINGQVYKPPKLPRPKPWATDRLYHHLWKRMEPIHKLETRVRSEKFVQQLARVMTMIMRCKKYEKYENDLNCLMKEMARLGIIETRQDFYHFCQEFLPYDFRVKAVPMLLPGNETNIPYDPRTLYQPILESQTDN